jgi:hypothetical protein
MITAPPFLVRPVHPSLGPRLFVWLAHLIAAPHSLCPAGASHRRATISLFAGAFAADPPPIWCCSVWLEHSPPSRHRFGVVPFGRCIPRRAATDLVLFHLAGAFPAKPPPIWCCSIWSAHSPLSRHRFDVVPFGRRIPRRAATELALFHLAGAFPADLVSSFSGAFTANHPIWCCSIWLAHPLATPPLPILAIASPCRATIAYLDWCIPLPHHHHSFWTPHPLAAPPLPI